MGGCVVKSGKVDNGYDKPSFGQDALNGCLPLLLTSGDSRGLIAIALPRGNKLCNTSHKSDSHWWVKRGGGDTALNASFKSVAPTNHRYQRRCRR